MSIPGDCTVFLCGDVMTGRGIDQILPRSCPAHLHEPFIASALEYVELAERVNGPIPRPVEPAYVWGSALEVLARARPDARIINLETSITTSEHAVPKGINYRMHPSNVAALTAAGIECCVLANNHVLDWGEAGLLETLGTLEQAGIAVAGAGRDLRAARAPAVLEVGGGGRVLVFAFGARDSGIPPDWSAGSTEPGIWDLPGFSGGTAESIGSMVRPAKRPGDIAVASIHWGGNWGYEIPRKHRHFAHALIDRAQIDIVHGHSSHHPKAVEIYRDRPIFYGCGDFLNDYEGIPGHEAFRGDLVLMYLPSCDLRTGRLIRLEMVPLQIRNFRLNRPSPTDRAWLHRVLGRECGRFGHRVSLAGDRLALEWS